jgi:AraC-like DNA-binding protein
MDKTVLPLPAQTPADVRRLAQQTLAALVKRIAAGDLTGVHIPLSTPLFCDQGVGTHYHSRPELFLQVSGTSRMRLLNGVIRCKANGLLLIPRGVAHHETADSTHGSFCNLVFMHGSGDFSYHAGLPSTHAKTTASPITIGGSCRVLHAYGSQLYGYLNEAADVVEAGHSVRHPVVQGLLLAHLGVLQTLIASCVLPARSTESTLVASCRRLVQEQLADARLSVQYLAGQLHCTPDYLSTRFRHDNGLRLTLYINQERYHLARHLLRTNQWNIKEVAARCGYADAGYFSRIFSLLGGVNPRDFCKAEVRREVVRHLVVNSGSST